MRLLAGLLLGGALIAAVACGGDEEPAPTSTPRPTATPGGAQPTATATSAPAPTATAQPSDDLIAAPAPQTPGGEAVIAFPTSGSFDQNGRNAAQASDALKNYGLAETLFRRAPDDSHLPWLATGFEITPDLSSATVFIQEGVEFRNKDRSFGMMTAEDVAFSMNDANANTNPSSIHGQAGDFAGLWDEWRVVDDFTIEFDFIQYDGTWKDDFVNQSGQAFPVFSKAAFDEMGEAWVRDNIVATGPYVVDEWARNEQLTMINHPDEHWLNEPETDTISLVRVQEATTRLALLRTGEIDAARLEPKDAARLNLNEFGQTGTGGSVQLGVFFSGNLWEDVDATTGEPLPTKATFVHDLPWIGSPGLHDTNTDDDVDDMEQARQIRRALAIAIDREAVNQALLAGLGDVVHVEYFSASHPNWDPKWEYYYDPDEAAQIIMEQDPDYQKGSAPSDGPLGENAFEVSIYAGPELGGGSSVTGEVVDAVAGFWSDIGLTTFSLKFSYQTFRPTVVGRSNTHPWVTSCDKGRESNPWHFPKGLVQTTLTRGGFSCGFESPEILDLYTRMAEAPDTATAVQAANEYLDYVYFWNLQPGVVAVPQDYFFNTNKISAWPMDKAAASDINNLWDLELK